MLINAGRNKGKRVNKPSVSSEIDLLMNSTGHCGSLANFLSL